MHIILDKPSLSFKKGVINLDSKEVFIYTNELDRVCRTGIVRYLVNKNKICALNPQVSVNKMNSMERFEL